MVCIIETGKRERKFQIDVRSDDKCGAQELRSKNSTACDYNPQKTGQEKQERIVDLQRN